MFQFDAPWWFVALPLPWLVWKFLPPYRERTYALRMPFLEQMAAAAGETPAAGAVIARSNRAQKLLGPLCWLFIVTALAKPQYVEPPLQHIEAARDLLLAVDLSQSMETRDFTAQDGQREDRLSAVKIVIHDFIERRRDDRIGLIVFGNGAFPQAPLTLDHAGVQWLLGETRIGMAGPQTAIGDAIGVAIKMTQDSDKRQRVLILLTDGNDTASRLPPAEAAKIARENQLVVHTVGIGDPKASGENRVDLESLKNIAATTDGRSFRAEDRQQLDEIYQTLDALNPHEIQREQFRPKRPLYWIPLAAGAVLLLAYHAVALLHGWARAVRATRGAREA